ncbi:hypothetical protein Pint_18034 [Pistacia integerrima]|uniref:Uncharacterized protein n=1 Tax=Pistacia integerrima TaxID=434235 RepID=A0ACC0YWF1_9ROSI|nr:hypothetical protein Pint_18034 [Pistacia integerrima]
MEASTAQNGLDRGLKNKATSKFQFSRELTKPEMVRSHLDPEDFNYYKFSTVCVVREENEEESFLVVHLPGKIIHHNFEKKSFKKIYDFVPSECEIECDSGDGSYADSSFSTQRKSCFCLMLLYWHFDLSIQPRVFLVLSQFSLLRLNLFPKSFTGLFIRHLGRPVYYFINLSSSPSPAPFKSLTFENDSSDSGINIQQSCNGLLN